MNRLISPPPDTLIHSLIMCAHYVLNATLHRIRFFCTLFLCLKCTKIPIRYMVAMSDNHKMAAIRLKFVWLALKWSMIRNASKEHFI